MIEDEWRQFAARVGAIGLTALAAGCGSVGDTTEPVRASEATVQYSMEQSEFLPHSALPPNLMVVMTLRNSTAGVADKSYPAGCPVMLRLYRALDSVLLYDETRRACALDTPATLRVLPGESRTIGSGFRQMTQIMGDSIPCGRYRLVGVPRTEGTTLIEVDAGEAFLRAYPAWPSPNPDAVYQC